MSDKHKFMYTPGNHQPSLRTSYQPSTSYGAHNSPVQVPFMNFNTSLNIQKPTQPEPPASSQYKSLSMSMKQFQSKVESVYPGLKREDSNGLRSTTDNMDFLRSSVSTNQVKKVDKDFLRRTAYTPNNPKIFNIGSDEPQGQTQAEHPSSTNMFHKKLPESDTPGKGPSSAFFKSLYQQQQRQSLQKRSPIVCGFYLGKQLGVGKFGEVYLAKHITSGFVCALKKIVKAKVREYNMLNQLTQEIKIQAFLSHPNIVQFYSVLSDELNIYIVLEYMEGGTLFDYMNTKQILQEQEGVVFLREISMAIKEMHDKDIAHRDIKPENIVMSYGFTKLCDFGWAARIQGARKTYCGTLDYVPPEILERKQYDQTVDLWCLGILAYELLTGKVPFEHKERKMLVQKIVNVDKDKIVFPETMSAQARDFIENLIKKNPNERMKSYKLLQHPFLYEEPKKEQKGKQH